MSKWTENKETNKTNISEEKKKYKHRCLFYFVILFNPFLGGGLLQFLF